MSSRRIVVVGSGPVGLEAARAAAAAGHDVQVFERGDRVAQSVRDWGFVRLFSPFGLNRSDESRREVAETGRPLPDDGEYLTGDEYCDRWLEPLAASPLLAGRVSTGHRVRAIGRVGLARTGPLAEARRGVPFRLLVESDAGERDFHADVVIDASGSYGRHGWLGDGGIPARGERRADSRVRYVLADVAGTQRDTYTGRRVLVVGDGFSAATAIDTLRSLPGTTIDWVSRHPETPYTVIEDDPLPERARLARLGNACAAGDDPAVRFHGAASIAAVDTTGDAVRVVLTKPDGESALAVDRVLALVGYAPDMSIHRELQVHTCWATEGPMKLAAALLAENGSDDCLSQTPQGPDALTCPEPDFFILGAKSYGRNSSFLIRVGLQQVRDVLSTIGPAGTKRPVAADATQEISR